MMNNINSCSRIVTVYYDASSETILGDLAAGIADQNNLDSHPEAQVHMQASPLITKFIRK